MKKTPWILAVMLTALTFTACTDDESSLTFAQTPDRLGGAFCEKVFNCCDAEERAEVLQFFAPNSTSAAECSTQYNQQVTGDPDFAALNAAIDAGTVIFNADRANTCISSLASANCGTFLDALTQDNCDTILTGTVADGGACTLDEQCIEGDCDEETCVSNADPTLGEACPNGFCENPYICEEGTCAERKGDGESCSGGDCADGLYCDSSASACAPLKAEGEACSGFNCAEGLYCDSGSSTCAPQKAGGESCASFEECRSFECTESVCEKEIACDGI